MVTGANQVKRGFVFLVLLAIGAALSSSAVMSLMVVSSTDEIYSHIPLIPLVSLYFLFLGRQGIFSEIRWDYSRGLPLIAVSLVLWWLGRHVDGNVNDHNHLSIIMSGFVVWILGAFLLVYGPSAARKGAFPLLFLFLSIPIPTVILDPLVRVLQLGSAEFSHVIFKVTGVPLHRDGLFFFLPGLSVEVAEQCSGIRSSIALFIIALLAGKLFLGSGWARSVLVFSILPISMFKNALRIVSLALLGAYVDPRFVTGSWLHDSGGMLFFFIALLLLMPVLWGMKKWEKRIGSSRLVAGPCKAKNMLDRATSIVESGRAEPGR